MASFHSRSHRSNSRGSPKPRYPAWMGNSNGNFAGNLEGDSPWSVSSHAGSGYNDLTLPPITDPPRDQYHGYGDNGLPSLHAQHLFTASGPPRLLSPSLFAGEPSNSTPPSHQPQQTGEPPSPENHRYRRDGSELSFSRFFDTDPMPASNRTTRSSSVVDLTDSPQHRLNNDLQMPPTLRKRKAETSGEGRAAKTARTASSEGTSKRELEEEVEIPLVDLEDVETAEEYEKKQALEAVAKAKEAEEKVKAQNVAESTKSFKLAEFTCVICMDNPSDLTVTHCGHLFCSECLHQALNIGEKKCCPVCRSVISTPKPGGRQTKNGVFHLELRLMTSNKKGKQPARN